MSKGILYIVATPIGNLDDMTSRACQVLKEVDLIVAEDTRHSKKLLQHFNIATPLKSYHAHNEKTRAHEVIEYLEKGMSVALISDAGTPLVSDPGRVLVEAAHNNKICVSPIPGACAAIAALSASGFSAGEFLFLGFLPNKTLARKNVLQKYVNERRTMIFYEATHRIVDSIEDMIEVFSKARLAVLAKEITKSFETIMHDELHAIKLWLEEDAARQKGEFVIVLKGVEEEAGLSLDDLRLLNVLLEELPVKKASRLAAEITGKSKNDFYKAGVQQLARKDPSS